MKPQKVVNHLDQSSDYRTGAMTAVNDPECQLNFGDLLNILKRNLEILRDDYLQQTETEFYIDVSEAPERTKHLLNPVDPLPVDWVSRDTLLSDYEANLKL
jgi:hypothetical protein